MNKGKRPQTTSKDPPKKPEINNLVHPNHKKPMKQQSGKIAVQTVEDDIEMPSEIKKNENAENDNNIESNEEIKSELVMNYKNKIQGHAPTHASESHQPNIERKFIS